MCAMHEGEKENRHNISKVTVSLMMTQLRQRKFFGAVYSLTQSNAFTFCFVHLNIFCVGQFSAPFLLSIFLFSPRPSIGIRIRGQGYNSREKQHKRNEENAEADTDLH